MSLIPTGIVTGPTALGSPAQTQALAAYILTQSNSDAGQLEDGTSYATTTVRLGVLQFNLDVVRKHTGFVFEPSGQGVPQGATINSATLNFVQAAATTDDDLYCTVWGDLRDDPPIFPTLGAGGGANDIKDRLTNHKTVASVGVALDNVGPGGTASIDVAAVVQELVNQAGFTDTSKIGLILEGNNIADFKAFQGEAWDGTGIAATLDVDFVSGPAVSVPAICGATSMAGMN